MRTLWEPDSSINEVPLGCNYPVNGDFGEYIPLFMLSLPNLSSFIMYIGDTKVWQRGGKLYGMKEPVLSHMKRKLSELGINTKNEYQAFFEVYPSLITAFTEETNVHNYQQLGMSLHQNHDRGQSSYEAMFRNLTNLGISKTNLRSASYYTGFHACWNSNGSLMWTMAIKKEYVKYYKLCLLLGKEIDPRIFTCLIQEGFDTKHTNNKPLRTAFRKYLKGKLEAANINSIEMNFRELLNGRITPPEGITSIKDMKNWENDLLKGFAEKSVIEKKISDAGVELSF